MAKNSRKKSRGQSIIELAVGLMALVPIVLVIFDLAVIVIGVQINDSTCREAARVAASGDPRQVTDRVNAVIARANQRSKGMLSTFRLGVPGIILTPANLVAQVTALDTYGGPVQGSVTVQTMVNITPFVVQYAYNGSSPLVFQSQQTFPFTYVVPNNAPAIP